MAKAKGGEIGKGQEKPTNLQDGVSKRSGYLSHVFHENPLTDPRCDHRATASTHHNVPNQDLQVHNIDQQTKEGSHSRVLRSTEEKTQGVLTNQKHIRDTEVFSENQNF